MSEQMKQLFMRVLFISSLISLMTAVSSSLLLKPFMMIPNMMFMKTTFNIAKAERSYQYL